MKFVVLASGSSGNATYIETPKVKLLIDVGITLKQIESRLNNQGIQFDKLDAIFITHEHGDHVDNLVSILDKTKAKLYINEMSYKSLHPRISTNLKHHKVAYIKADTKYTLHDLNIVPIELSHDAANTYGYLFESNGKTLGYISDTGFIPTKYLHILSKMKALIIESNYDVSMLLDSQRPWFLKERILSESGHMSNKACADVLKVIINDVTKYVILAHLSQECNTEEIALSQVKEQFLEQMTFKLLAAKPYQELELIEL
jgi:phosphoribosyl 1,2-cyclic phosphodiesterase